MSFPPPDYRDGSDIGSVLGMILISLALAVVVFG